MLNGLKQTSPTYQGDVWIMAERSDSKIHPATFELIGKARQLADSLNVRVGVVLAGKRCGEFEQCAYRRRCR